MYWRCIIYSIMFAIPKKVSESPSLKMTSRFRKLIFKIMKLKTHPFDIEGQSKAVITSRHKNCIKSLIYYIFFSHMIY